MIRLQRTEAPPTAWRERAAQATAANQLRVEADQAPTFDAAIYAHPQHVKPLLRRLSHGKCAYCESSLARQHGDVEHYRPKGAVAEDDQHPGYWWLAYEWPNLLLSCQLCNQIHRRLDGSVSGKGDHFPIAADGVRARSPGDDLSRERPLLLNPCVDDPDEHLEFGQDGGIVAKDGSPRGQVTIRFYGLDDPPLIDDRINHLELLRSVVQAWLADPTDPNRLEAIDLWMSDKAPHAQLTRQVIADPEAFGLA